MDLVSFAAGVLVGIVLGIGAALFYLRWKMRQQLGMMEDQMSNLMESTEEMSEGLGAMEDIGAVEEVENKEEENTD